MDALINFVGRMLNGLFSDIGKKLQSFAYVFIGLSFFGVCVSMLVDMYGFFNVFNILGFVMYGLMFVSALIFSWLIYGFGRLIEDIHQIAVEQDTYTSDFSDLPQL